MPCDTIQLNRVDVQKLTGELLRATFSELEAQGWKVVLHNGATLRTVFQDARGNRVTYTDGELESRLSEEQLAKFRNTLTKAYSRQAVLLAAKRQGWRVRQVGANQYEVQR